MSNASLTSRAKFHAIDTYKLMVDEIPKHLLSQPGTSPYYGSVTLPASVYKRRKDLSIETTKDNFLMYESNDAYNKYADCLIPELTRNTIMNTVPYADHPDVDLSSFAPKFSIRNLPYQKPGQGRANLYPTLIKNELGHNYEFTGDILPTAWLRSDSGDLKATRKMFVNNMGLYKIVVLPFSTFKEFGASLETAIYFCKKDYTGHITIEHFNEKNAYQYDFRKTDVIVTPRTKEEVDFIFDCVNKKKHYTILGVGSIFKSVKGSLRTVSDNEYAYPVIDKLKKTLINCKLKFTNQFFDADIGEHRVVTSYLSAGWGKGDKHVGNLVYIPPGYQLSGTYKYIVVKDKKEAEAVAFYLNSKFARYLMHYWRTSRTCDQPQWNSIPVLDKFDLDTEEKIVEHFVKDKSLQQKILNDKLHN